MFTDSTVFLLVCCFSVATYAHRHAPHIVFILADDMGWNDISCHGSPQIPTPNIDALCASGIVMKSHYAASTCTPSRASLMTGRYPSRTGLQHMLILAGQPSAIPDNMTVMPQHFKKLGYATHLIGKWHLGCHKKQYTPTYRGFDTFFGFWNGDLDYFAHTHYASENMYGFDLHEGLKPNSNFPGKYAAELFTMKAVETIRHHNSSQPLFLFLSQIAPRTGTPLQRQQAPPEHVAKFMHIENIRRRTYAGSVSTLDDSVGKVFAALHARKMLDNSIIVFVSDNGAEVEGQRGGYGSNWPLRGSKRSLWEGGVRVPAIIWSPLLRLRKPRVSKHMMHLSDWMPTLYAAAGGNPNDLGDIDGINFWETLVHDLPSPRDEILLNVNPILGMSSLIQGDYKIVNGTYTAEFRDLWYGPSGREDLNISSMDEWVWRHGSIVKHILHGTGRWLVTTPDVWRQDAIIDCGSSRPAGNGSCYPTVAPCLFNITEDPCEYHNLAPEQPQRVQKMTDRIQELNKKSLPPMNPPIDPNADPRCHNFYFVPWLEPEHRSQPCGLRT